MLVVLTNSDVRNCKCERVKAADPLLAGLSITGTNGKEMK